MWKSEAEDRLARSIAEGEVEGMNLDSVRAHAAATLALVEVTERLAVAQETANLIALANGVLSLDFRVVSGLSKDATEGVAAMHEEAVQRARGYLS